MLQKSLFWLLESSANFVLNFVYAYSAYLGSSLSQLDATPNEGINQLSSLIGNRSRDRWDCCWNLSRGRAGVEFRASRKPRSFGDSASAAIGGSTRGRTQRVSNQMPRFQLYIVVQLFSTNNLKENLFLRKN